MKLKALLLTFVFSLAILSASAQNNEEKYKQADEMIENFQFAEAASILFELIESEPNNYLYVKDLAFCYLSQFDYENAIKYFEEAIDLNPECIKCHSHLARAWYELGKIDLAKKAVDKGFALSDTTAHLYMNRGLILLAMEDYDNAMLDFTQAVQLDKENSNYLITRANFYIQTNQAHFAYSDISDAIELEPENAEYYYYRAYILLNLDLLDEALIDIQKTISLDNTIADYYNLQFSIYFSRLEYDLAEESIMKSLEILPNSHMAYINLADLYFQSNRMEQYCEANKKALELIPKENTYQIDAISKTTDKYCNSERMPYYFVRSLTLYNQSDYEATNEILHLGLSVIEKSTVLENLLATSYLSMQNYDKAFEYFTLSYEHKDLTQAEVIDFYSVDLAQEDIEYVANSYIVKSDFGLAMIHLMNHESELALKRLNDAEKMAESMEGFEGKEFIDNVKGFIYLLNSDYEEASKQFDAGIKRNPYYQQSYLNNAVLKLLQASKYKSSKLQFTFSEYFNSLRVVIPKLKAKKGQEEELKEALDICNVVIKNDPKCAYAYLIKAKVAEFLGDEEYKTYADKAIELGIKDAYKELNIK